MITFEKFQQVKVMNAQLDFYLDHPYFKEYHKLIAIDLSKQQKLDAEPKETQQINFTENLNRAEGTTMFYVIEEEEETVLDFSKRTVKVL